MVLSLEIYSHESVLRFYSHESNILSNVYFPPDYFTMYQFYFPTTILLRSESRRFAGHDLGYSLCLPPHTRKHVSRNLKIALHSP